MPIGVVIEALAGIDAHVVLTVGQTLDPDTWRPWPHNVAIFRNLPQQMVLTRSALLVSHAGSGAVLGAAAVGLPQLCVPVAADQFINADCGELRCRTQLGARLGQRGEPSCRRPSTPG